MRLMVEVLRRTNYRRQLARKREYENQIKLLKEKKVQTIFRLGPNQHLRGHRCRCNIPHHNLPKYVSCKTCNVTIICNMF